MQAQGIEELILAVSFPIQKTRKNILFAYFMISSLMVKVLEGRPSTRGLSCFSITSVGGRGLEQCRAGVRALTRMEFLSPCLGSFLRPRREAVCKCQAAQLRVKTAWNLYTFLHGFKFSHVHEWGWLQPKEVFMKWQRKSVLTEQVPENILKPLLSLWFDFSPCYNGSGRRVWKNIRVTRAEGISDGDEG